MGFAESIANLIKVDEQYMPWVQRGLATGVVFILASFNIAGVKWVIKLQFLLLIALLLSAADFFIGSFVNHPDPGTYVCDSFILPSLYDPPHTHLFSAERKFSISTINPPILTYSLPRDYFVSALLV